MLAVEEQQESENDMNLWFAAIGKEKPMENLNTSSCLTNGETKEQRNKRPAYDFYRYIGNADYEKAKAMCDPNEFIFHPMIYINADLDGFIDLEAMHMDPMPGFTFTICNIIYRRILIRRIHDKTIIRRILIFIQLLTV